MDGGGFLTQGGYGCVYHPEVTCKGKDTQNTNFLSKKTFFIFLTLLFQRY